MSAVINPTSAVAQVAAASQATPRARAAAGHGDRCARAGRARKSRAHPDRRAFARGADGSGAATRRESEACRLADRGGRAACRRAARDTGQAAPPPAGGSTTTPAGATPASANSVGASIGATAQAQLPRVAAASLVPASPEAIAVSQAVQTAAPRQAGLSPLFANLPVIVAVERRAAAGAERRFNAPGHAPAARQHADSRRPASGLSKIRAVSGSDAGARRGPSGGARSESSAGGVQAGFDELARAGRASRAARGCRASVGAAGIGRGASSASAWRTAKFAAAGGHGHVAVRAGPSVRCCRCRRRRRATSHEDC